jgi:branched-chain amino acid transport system ATP-binding protein
MLSVNHIDFFYGEVQVLKDVSLTVNKGEFVTIFGPNGHGKSTLLKTICGLYRPAAGSIEYDGHTISEWPIERIVSMGLTYIPEDRHLFPEMTVWENLRMGSYVQTARARERQSLEYVYHLFPKLPSLRNQLANCLSGGEARMLAIGRGLMSNPKFLCIDEPSLGLAPNLRVEVFKAVEEIRQSGVSILLVEQSTSIAADYADRVYILEDGGIAFSGTRDEAMGNTQFKEVFLGM